MSRPLSSPIWSGPSASITLWGIDDFETFEGGKDCVQFRVQDCYFRNCHPSEANGWILSIYAFPAGRAPPCRYVDGELICDVACERVSGPIAAVMRMKIVRLQKGSVILGLSMNRAEVFFSTASGWVINGPGDWSVKQAGHVLMASYPRDMMPTEGMPSLDR